MKKHVSKLGEILLDRHLISTDQLEHALQEQKSTKQRLGTILIQNHWISEDDLNFILSQQLDMPYVHLNLDMIDLDLVKSIPQEVLVSYNVLPLIRVDDELTVVMSDPTDSKTIADLESITKCKIRPALARPSNIQQVLESIFGTLSLRPSESAVSYTHLTHPGSLDFFRKYIEDAITFEADEIHFEPTGKDVRIRYRIEKQLVPKESLSQEIYLALLSRVKIVFQFDFTKQHVFQSGTIAFHTGQNTIQLEGVVLITARGELLTLRIHQTINSPVSLDEQALGPLFQRVLLQLSRTGGVILISSKSDWLRTRLAYMLLQGIQNEKRKIITIEKTFTITDDRYIQLSQEKMQGIALKEIFHQSLILGGDVLMVDLADSEDLLGTVFDASVREKLIIGTLPYLSVNETLICLQNRNIKPSVLKSYLLSIIAGAQFQSLCPSCRILNSTKQPTEKSTKKAAKKSYYHSTGCAKCDQTGYIGYQNILEIFIPAKPVKKLLGTGKDVDIILKMSEKEGFDPIIRQSIENAQKGIISMEEIYQKFGELEI